ncbi:related to PMS1 - DNA mismatch repair protein [Moesziomyces antarcticus]|uniref:DNA mismatch repair protein PMS1 n=2 Tax=Pseudozyma antarctica TaxID=84753 RepID=A0A5C3FJ76_PSEA2|nr:related to PMS1 - DNA mismatch repair protein [Moesziomyces antarcticus]DBA11355.1 TPA_inf: PMS1 [Moesziomyces antarcticus]
MASASTDPQAAGSAIRAIPTSDVHRITSGQVVLDLQTAVKELVENALDASASNIAINFRDYGADSFEVVDNGSGIDPSNYASVALKHYTSKLASFSDLAHVRTFGFRGEALSSLCALASVTIHTATSQQAPMGAVLRLDRSGRVADDSGRAARQRGTTITIEDLFKSLPVRRKEFEKNLKREYAKTQNLLQAYALITKGVRWTTTNQPSGGRKTPQFSVNSSSADNYLAANVSALFGAKVAPTLMPLSLELTFSTARKGLSAAQKRGEQDDDEGDEEETANDASTVTVVGLISKPVYGSGRTSSDRQFFYINGRPWEAGRVSRAFNEVYKSFNSNHFPFIIADFRLPTDSYDVNVSPDKRTIFLHEESRLIEKLKQALEELFAPSRATFLVNGASHSLRSGGSSAATQAKLGHYSRTVAAVPTQAVDGDRSEEEEDELVPSQRSIASVQDLEYREDIGIASDSAAPIEASAAVEADESEPEAPLPHAPEAHALLSMGEKRKDPTTTEPPMKRQRNSQSSPEPEIEEALSAVDSSRRTSKEIRRNLRDFALAGSQDDALSPMPSAAEMHSEQDEAESMDDDDLTVGALHEEASDVPSPEHSHAFVLPPSQPVLAEAGADTNEVEGGETVSVDLARLRPRARQWREHKRASTLPARTTTLSGEEQLLQGAGVENADEEQVERTLSRVIHKQDFASMDVIGQFNLGFIIARRRTNAVGSADEMDDLFIVDQHASDEKYNFETLQLTTQIRSQKLICPRALELSASDELVAIEHQSTLLANGFEIAVSESGLPGTRIKLVAQPISKTTVFGVKDLEELLYLLRDMSAGTEATRAVRCSKARSMFASRACRKSVMIGTALNKARMGSILANMGTIEQPWNCPHGRPTMRHLACLQTLADMKPQACKDDEPDWTEIQGSFE